MMKRTLGAALFISFGLCNAMLNPYTVTTTEDNVTGSLRDAINQVNTGAYNAIYFNLTGPTPFVIQPQSDLPMIKKQVLINGFSQNGASPTNLLIMINGSNYTIGDGVSSGNGLHFIPGSDNSTVQGLVINQWISSGILIDNSSGIGLSGIKVTECFIGTDATGTQQQANRTGIGLSGTSDATIDSNVIAGSFSWFLVDNYNIRGAGIFSNASMGTTITNNTIGTDKTGSYALGNSSTGIHLLSDQNATISNNLISGHNIYGIRLFITSNSFVQNNYIGTDITGTQPIGNANAGVELDFFAASNCLIGNVISGNGAGIVLGQAVLPGSTLNTIQGNKIGTDATGTKALPNQGFGIRLNDSQNTIGGLLPEQANIISSNLGGGILLFGSANTTSNLVANNLIGTDITGTQPLPNKGNGIQIGLNGGFGGASGNTIGSSPLLSTTTSCTTELTTKPEKRIVLEQKRKLRNHEQRILEPKLLKAHPTGAVISMPQINKNMKQLLSQPAQTIGLNFTAASVSNTFFTSVIPPQQGGWVGPQQYILISYGIIRSFDKTTGLPDGVLNIDSGSFFGFPFTEEPRIDYSRFIDRWFLSCEAGPGLLVTWSDSGVITPETVWTSVSFSVADLVPQNPASFVFENQPATDANAVYFSVIAGDDATGNYEGTSIVVIPNSSITTGNTSPEVTIFSGVLPGQNPTILGKFVPPADNFDPDAQFGYLINAANDFYGSGFTYDQLYLYRILNPGSTPATLGQEIALNVPPYTDPQNAPNKNLYTKIGAAMFLETSNSQVHAPHVRNKQLYVCHNVQVDNFGNSNPSGDRVGVRWYQFDLTGDPTGNGCGVETETTCPALVQWGTLFDPALIDNPKFYFVPAIMTNKNGDLVIEGTVSGNNDYTNVFYAGRKATDPLGSLRDPVLVTNNTSNPYNYGPLNPQRWGDYTNLAPDPSNDLIIWSTGEWAAIENGWGIQATQLLPTK